MKFFAGLAIFLFVAGFAPAQAQQNADDQYIVIYGVIQQADSLASAGRPQSALTQYTDAQNELKKFQRYYPDWNPKIVSFRLNYLAGKITTLTAQLPAPIIAAPVATEVRPPTAPAPGGTDDLSGQVQALQAVNNALQAKLKEALAAQPTAVDARELTRAQEKITALMKDNELLKTTLVQAKLKADGGSTAVQTEALKRAQLALSEANQKLSAQLSRADQLALENQALQTRRQPSPIADTAALDALRAENGLLKKQLAELRIAATNFSSAAARLEADLKAARLQVAAMQSAAQIQSLEKAALENRLSKIPFMANGQPAPMPVPTADQLKNEARIRELTQERNDLLAKLGAANRELYGAKKQSVAAQIGDLNDQIKTLRARLAVNEALAVPYTAEELALFKSAPPQLAGVDTAKKSIKELPDGSAPLVAEAQKFFAAKQFAKAEENYRKILSRDASNPIALGNLAAIEMQQGKLDEAAQHLTTAVAQNPDDGYNLSLLGYVKFQQGKYDEALNTLSRAAKLEPLNPEIQNYLGIALSQKGQRVPAETALRKAVQLAPGYAAAHNNLAVIYLNQTPSLVQLARWHYQKALAAGQPPNLELEKALTAKGTPVTPQ